MAVLHRMFRQPVGLEPDWTFTQESDRYSEADHRTWISLYDRPAEIVSRRACNAFLNGLDALDLHGQRVPDFDQLQLNEKLLALTGWRVVAVPGLVPDAVYFDHLANRRFPAANFIRRANELDYSQKPDIFHDVFGHVPILSTVSFDAFLFELCLSTLSGARLILAPPEQTPPGERLAAFGQFRSDASEFAANRLEHDDHR